MSGHTTRRDVLALRATEPYRLLRLVELEQLAVDGYTLAIELGRLTPAVRSLAEQIREQERQHAVAIARHVPVSVLTTTVAGTGTPAGGSPTGAAGALASPVATPAALERALDRAGIRTRVASLHDQQAWIGLLQRIEVVLTAAHFRAVRELKDVDAATLIASILADEAQHSTVLTRAKHPRDVRRAVPFPVVPADASIQL